MRRSLQKVEHPNRPRPTNHRDTMHGNPRNLDPSVLGRLTDPLPNAHQTQRRGLPLATTQNLSFVWLQVQLTGGNFVFRARLSKTYAAVLLLVTLMGAVQDHAAAAAASYTYDQLGRVTTALYDNLTCVVYGYDANGNRTSQTITVSSGPESPTWGSGSWGCFRWTPH
jgi:hypothetical protein